MRLIGITGKKGAGKSTAATYLRNRHGFAGSNLTDPMDEMLTPLLRRMGVPEHEIMLRLSGLMKDTPIAGYEWLSGRKLKQALGLEFRDAVSRPTVGGKTDQCFFQDIWYGDNSQHPKLVHEQIRYDFEADKVREKGGIVIKITDPDAPDDDQHPSERIDFAVDAEIVNPKTGMDALHAALDALVGEEPASHVVRSQDDSPIATLDADIDEAFNGHGDEIRAYADRLDAGDQSLSERVDDLIAEIKGSVGADAANAASEQEADAAIGSVERWITDNVSNSTSDRRIAAIYAQLGGAGAREALG